MDERRKFTRTLFAATASIKIEDKSYRTDILDLSIKGALISTPDGLDAIKGQKVALSFLLPDSDIVLSMDTLLVHKEAKHLGLECQHIDLDSISHLKRIIELNIGDEELLQRELAQLVSI
ncbi:PilZ domain-containing protein [Shewanella sp. 1_MG-2023]|uniref:Cyclic diguanosine monophosphate-binding protein n=1 Tax=Shewanella electrodiphila TaxID=934143 RepID=A0ABT0KLK5_9GAMM|nr:MULTISPECIES: PilZ domain-containing protein [Shewanella]MCC4832209.1 PilZ domain-containing protein [Shewanella sp. 10N.7]MCL1044618.1 PilZ domain-containing protein [Shewanella electrodiphila]MDO6610307.1 PilZ domain-containing protein [Shewanella sp. 7_MG-2023]MDO6770432.1 PilZ domain-containing protein [Shewanella sp. 2_MG-2023]MDO6794319.1 PilZ domain-containing protein [Shewanella sp. 1_MG-2023]